MHLCSSVKRKKEKREKIKICITIKNLKKGLKLWQRLQFQ